MKVVVSITGVRDHTRVVSWPEDFPIPRVGEDVEIPILDEVSCVRTVVWYPDGDLENPEPFVYIVIGPRGPR